MKTRIAEWILSLVLPPERALSVVGDFAESAERRGGSWFWTEVFRTVTSLVARDLLGNPGFWTSLAIRGWILSMIGTAGLFFGSIFLLTLGLMVYGWITSSMPAQDPAFRAISEIAGFALVAWPSYWTGRWLGRRAPNREFAAAIAATLIPMLVMNVAVFVVIKMWGNEIEHWAASLPDYGSGGCSPGYFVMNLFSATCVFAGALRVRYRFLRGVV